MLARADPREQPDAKPGPPRRAPADTTPAATAPPPPYDRDQDRERGPLIRNELRKLVRSGELTVGVLLRNAYGPERWYWFLSGLTHPDDEDFRWQGEATSEVEAFVLPSTCWQQWTRWAGLEPIAELQFGLKQ